MDSHEESGYPFAIPDLWHTIQSPEIPSGKVVSPTDCWVLTKHGLDLGLDVAGKNDDLSGFFGAIDFSIPDIDELEFTSLDDFESQEESFTPELSVDSADERENVPVIAQATEEDIWLCPDVTAQVEPHPKLKSWEIFNDSGFKEPQPSFISERGPIAFDAAVIAHEHEGAIGDKSGAKVGKILQSAPFLKVGVHRQV